MAEDCVGRHVCEPPFWPTNLGQSWHCDECGADHYAFDVHAHYANYPTGVPLHHVPVGTLGWTTRELSAP